MTMDEGNTIKSKEVCPKICRAKPIYKNKLFLFIVVPFILFNVNTKAFNKLRQPWNQIRDLPTVSSHLTHLRGGKKLYQKSSRDYEYMRRRTKRFPWGEGQKSLFHNDKVNVLPTECIKTRQTYDDYDDY